MAYMLEVGHYVIHNGSVRPKPMQIEEINIKDDGFRWAKAGDEEYRVDTLGLLLCIWFVNCVRPAVALRDHPALGSVPICQGCDDWVRGIQAGRVGDVAGPSHAEG